MEMSGNQFLDLLRRVPKSVASDLLNNAVTEAQGLPQAQDEREFLWSSAQQIIATKKR